jgi:hypothetical protein
MPYQLDVNFKPYNNSDLIIKLGGIADILANHSRFLLPYPDVVPNPDQLKVHIANFTAAVTAAANGDRQKISERDLFRAELEQVATFTAQYLIMKAFKEKDPSMLNNVGYDQKKRTTKGSASSNASVIPPTNFTAKHGPVSGTVIVKASRVIGAAMYELHICQGDPTIAESWTTLGLFTRSSRMEVKELTPGQKYNFRGRCLGNNGPGPWSITVSLMVI